MSRSRKTSEETDAVVQTVGDGGLTKAVGHRGKKVIPRYICESRADGPAMSREKLQRWEGSQLPPPFLPWSDRGIEVLIYCSAGPIGRHTLLAFISAPCSNCLGTHPTVTASWSLSSA